MRHATKLYSWLLSLYPARFREDYQTPMEIQFHDEYREAESSGARALLLLHFVWDVITSAPVEMMRELRLDLKHAFRVYQKRSFSMALAVLALGLAIGASTGVFSVLNALLLRSLPFFESERLVELWLPPVGPLSGRAAFMAGYRRSPYLESAAAFSSSEMNLTNGRDAFRIKAAETSANFFELLGMRPVAGRTFTPGEDILGRNDVAVISYALWQQMFGGDPDAMGKSILVNGVRFSVIGIAPAAFDYPGKTTLWIPTLFDFERVPKRGAFLLQTIGRLKQDVTIQQAQDVFQAEARRALPAGPDTPNIALQVRPHIASLQNQLAGPVRQAGWVLAGMTLLVLLTACANVAQLLLSRATERRQELEIRAALGASRARLLQQLITEATLLTLSGAVVGLAIAYWTSRIASSVVPAQLASQGYTILDWRVLGFAIALALAMGIVFGVIPAWLIGRLQPSGSVVRSQTGTQVTGTRRARQVLVALQAGLTLALLTGSFTMGDTFLRLLHVDLGFRPSNAVTLSVSLQGTAHRGSGEWRYYSDVLARLRALPEVESAGAVSHLPLAENIYMANAFTLDAGQTVQRIVTNGVTPDYFRSMGTPFLAGRDFTASDDNHARRIVIVNEAFANSVGLGLQIVGRKLTAPWSHAPYEISGIVSTTRAAGPEHSGQPEIFWPVAEEPGAALTFVAAVRGPSERYLAQCRDTVRMLDPKVPVYDVKTLDQRLADVLSRPRFYTTATFFLAALAILLAVVGIYGTAAYSISQRKHEMGIRMAVGASPWRVRKMILRESVVPIVCGAAAGLVLSTASGTLLAHLLEAASQPAPWTYSIAAGLMLLAGLMAAWRATAKVLSIDPANALRAE